LASFTLFHPNKTALKNAPYEWSKKAAMAIYPAARVRFAPYGLLVDTT
jgi:hypothetical protein